MNDIEYVARGIELPPVTLAVLGVFAVWLVVGETWVGYRTHRRFLAQYKEDATAARRRLYGIWTSMLAVLGAALVIAFSVLPGLSVGMLGLRAMYDVGDMDPGLKLVVGGVGAGIVAGLIASIAGRRRSGSATGLIVGAGKVEPMLPRTPRERISYMLLATVASVVEEIAWRGLIVFIVSLCWPGADMATMACVSGIAFGLVHLYQGWVGVVASAVMGAVLCVVYVRSGSLLLPVILHMAVNYRAVLMAPSSKARIGQDGVEV